MRLKTGGTKRLNVVLHNQDYCSSLLAGGQVIAARNVCRRVVFHMVEIPKIDMQFDFVLLIFLGCCWVCCRVGVFF